MCHHINWEQGDPLLAGNRGLYMGPGPTYQLGIRDSVNHILQISWKQGILYPFWFVQYFWCSIVKYVLCFRFPGVLRSSLYHSVFKIQQPLLSQKKILFLLINLNLTTCPFSCINHASNSTKPGILFSSPPSSIPPSRPPHFLSCRTFLA